MGQPPPGKPPTHHASRPFLAQDSLLLAPLGSLGASLLPVQTSEKTLQTCPIIDCLRTLSSLQAGLLLAPLGSLGASLLPLLGVGYLLVAVVLFTQVRQVDGLLGEPPSCLAMRRMCSACMLSARRCAVMCTECPSSPASQRPPTRSSVTHSQLSTERRSATRAPGCEHIQVPQCRWAEMRGGQRAAQSSVAAHHCVLRACCTTRATPGVLLVHLPLVPIELPASLHLAGLAVVGLAHAASLVSWWQAGILAHTKLAAAKVGVQSALAAFALYNYACAKK